MISVQEAKKIISKNVSSLEPVLLPLSQAAGLILAEDIYATKDIPAFSSVINGWLMLFLLKDGNNIKIKDNREGCCR
jgi:hypothetical protein